MPQRRAAPPRAAAQRRAPVLSCVRKRLGPKHIGLAAAELEEADHMRSDHLRDLAKRELPSALRNQATIGGTVALGEPTSVLVAGLLVHGADVVLHSGGVQELEAVLAAED